MFDCLAILFAFLFAFLLRFDFHISPDYLNIIVQTLPFVLVTYVLSARFFSLYGGIFYFSSFSDLVNITKAVASGGLISAALIMFIRQGQFPRSVLILHPILTFLGICGIRFGIRLVKTHFRLKGLPSGDSGNVLIMGAGELGESLVRQIQKTPESGYNVVGILDDDRAKWGMRLHGCRILGSVSSLSDVLRKHEVDVIIIAIASQRGKLVRSVVETLKDVTPRPELKIAPALDEMLKPHASDVSLRKVKPSDLLNRGEVHLNQQKIARKLERKCVLVSGAGGTIGSELCRQALRYQPEKIILLENHATSLFYRDDELRRKDHGTAIVSVLGDVRDQGLLERVFKEHNPQVVLHAAAHKHVHQLEFNIPEALSNNVIGTYHLAKAAVAHGAETFLLVSTDKAVRPASVMGATKRLAEKIIQGLAENSKTRFTAVRFGNVLGSSGSVLKIFQEQIARGGPITVTHASATRYFMTVEESVGLILQAVSMAKGGEIFVLKMGTPVRIIDMAQNLILLSGLEIGKDIEIRITGLKQGEKLDEELMEDPAGVSDSEHPDIFLLGATEPPKSDLEKRILDLEILCRGTDIPAMLAKLQEFVATFNPASSPDIPKKHD
ncbi:polysaccharide biosynthesis protein [Elusimicrobiota bacterium]